MNQTPEPRIAYLINQYPKISHTFIRREILALEAQGVQITRISIRESADTLCDETDKQEKQKTIYMLSRHPRCVYSFFTAALSCLPRMLPAIAATFALMSRSCSILKPVIYLLEACWLYQFCTSQGISHIHTHFGTNAASVAMLCRKLKGPEFSVTIHGPEEFDSLATLALDRKILESKFVVAISSFCRSQLFRWVNYQNWGKIVEIRCTVDEDFIAPDNYSLIEQKRFVSIGRLCEQKGQLLLLQAFAMVLEEHPDVRLHIIGDGELRCLLEGFINTHKMHDNILLHGWQDASQISMHIDQCSALILPSLAEGLPVVIMEAFARRRPVLSTYIAGIPELVDAKCGWLIPAGDVYKLRDSILQIISTSSEKIYEMGNVGLERVRTMHDSHTEAKKLKLKLTPPKS